MAMPRVGGQTTPDTCWTGGSNIVGQQLNRAKTVMATRTLDFWSAEKICNCCTKGLPDEMKLGPSDDVKGMVTITTWISMIKDALEDRGMDTVMRIFNPVSQVELNMLDEKSWGRVAKEDVTEWVKALKETGVFVDGQAINRHPVCPQDVDNLSWSGKFILASIKLSLWEIIEKEVGSSATGPQVFLAVVQEAQVSTASMVQVMTDDLKKMSLKQEPGQNVISFSSKIIEVARKIEGSILDVPNLNSLVLAPFLHCDVEAFRMCVTEKHMKADRVTGNTTTSILATAGPQVSNSVPQWLVDINDLKQRFRELKGQNLWTPLSNTKPRANEINALKAQLQASQQNRPQGGP